MVPNNAHFSHGSSLNLNCPIADGLLKIVSLVPDYVLDVILVTNVSIWSFLSLNCPIVDGLLNWLATEGIWTFHLLLAPVSSAIAFFISLVLMHARTRFKYEGSVGATPMRIWNCHKPNCGRWKFITSGQDISYSQRL